MWAVIKNKWDINYIQRLPTKSNRKCYGKYWKKVFITKKCTQCEISNTLKQMIFELPDNKHIGKLFLKYELLFLDQSNSSSNPFQVVNSLQNDRCSFIFIALPVHATTPTFPNKNFLQLISTSLFRPYLFI